VRRVGDGGKKVSRVEFTVGAKKNDIGAILV